MKKTTEILNSSELSGAPAVGHMNLSSVASPEPQLITTHSASDETTIPLWVRKTRLKSPTHLQRLKLASQPIQHTGNYGGGTPGCSNPWWQLQRLVARAVRTVFYLDASDELLCNGGLWNTAYDNWRQFRLFKEGAKEDLFPSNKHVSSTAIPLAEKKNDLRNVFFKNKGSFAACLRNLRTDIHYNNEHSQTLYRLKWTLQTQNCMLYL